MSVKPYYQKDGITIFNARCEDVLPQLSNFDLLLTDPPYGIGIDRAMHKSGGTKYGLAVAPKRHYDASGWDDAPPLREILNALRAKARYQIIFGGNYFWLPPTSCWLVWDKMNGKNCFADCELAWTNLKKAVRRTSYRWNGMLRDGDDTRHHPTQKPLAVMQWCLRQAPKEVETVFDPYMGVGTTLVAAKLAGKSAVGVEMSKDYCDVAVGRLGGKVAKALQGGFGVG